MVSLLVAYGVRIGMLPADMPVLARHCRPARAFANATCSSLMSTERQEDRAIVQSALV